MRTSHSTLPTILPNRSGMPVLALLYITPASISVTEGYSHGLPEEVYTSEISSPMHTCMPYDAA